MNQILNFWFWSSMEGRKKQDLEQPVFFIISWNQLGVYLSQWGKKLMDLPFIRLDCSKDRKFMTCLEGFKNSFYELFFKIIFPHHLEKKFVKIVVTPILNYILFFSHSSCLLGIALLI